MKNIYSLFTTGSATEEPQVGVLCAYSCGIKTAYVFFSSILVTVVESTGQFGFIGPITMLLQG
jgi:hypothetical protein